MDRLLVYLAEVSICMGISLGIYRVMLSGLTFFSWNRSILLGLLVLSGLIPLLSFELFGIGETVSEFTLPAFQVGEQVMPTVEQWITWNQLLIWVYFLGAIFTASRLVFGFMISLRLIGKAKKVIHDSNLIAVHPEFVPASFFGYILMPDFNPESGEQKQIILHESMHVSLHHSWDLLLVNFGKVLFWFNPLIYLFEKSLREVHEYQADQGVTSSCAPKEYATLLLHLITTKPGWQFMNNFNQLQTKKRIQMMSKSRSSQRQKLKFLTMIPAVALLLFVFSCEKGDLTPQLSMAKPLEKPISQDLSSNELFDEVEQMPLPNGGMVGWSQYLSKNLNYPLEARRMGIEGTVIVVFEIHKDGSIHNVEILQGIGGGADQEAMRVVAASPAWEPGRQKGQAVNTRMKLPVRFKLG